MNIVKPVLIWVDGRCYRSLNNYECSDIHALSPYVEDNCDVNYKDSEEECFDDNIEIVPYMGTKFKHIYPVAKSLFPFIAGPKHAVRKRLETETSTIIQIPKVGQDGDIEIISSDRRNIITACHRINLLIAGARRKLSPTHFLSIPLIGGHMPSQFNTFKNEVLTNSERPCRGVNESIFQNPWKLHLTIGLLTLLDDTERNQAIEALNYCKEHILKPVLKKYKKIPIVIQGVDIMNDDPSETKILYGKVDDKCEALQKIVFEMANYYKSIGLLSKYRDSNKLHVTLMSVKFQFTREEDTNYSSTFDATEILKAYENTIFTEETLAIINLSQRHTTSSTGCYQTTASINIFTDL